MKILFLLILSFSYIFASTNDFVVPTVSCVASEVNNCNTKYPGSVCKVDYDGLSHCILHKNKPSIIYTDEITNPNGNEDDYKELNGFIDEKYTGFKQRKKYERIIGDMDVIGASVIVAKRGYSFEPRIDNTGGERFATVSRVLPLKFENEEPGLGGAYGGKFLNSSRATFNFSDKSNYEKLNIDKSKIIYARLYWGGAIYEDWQVNDAIVDNFFKEIHGIRTVNFKTPDGKKHRIEALEEDIQWQASFSEYQRQSSTLNTLKHLCKKPGTNQIGPCNTTINHTEFTVAICKDPASGDAIRCTTGVKSGPYIQYQASADVTKLVQESLGKTEAERTFAVGNIASSIFEIKRDFSNEIKINGNPWPALKSYGSFLYVDGDWSSSYIPAQYGGWSLVIVYDFGNDGINNNVKPKAVNLYDGLFVLSTPSSTAQVNISKLHLKFDKFYTPSSGNINSNLALLSFGGRPEANGEDIRIKKDSNFYSINTGPFNKNILNYGGSPYNPEGNQFNSSITKFNAPMNPYKLYNNQMDLDVFDISSFLKHMQNEVELELQASVTRDSEGNYIGDRVNIGMAGFSTLLYEPNVCYIEELQVLRNGQWKDVLKKADVGTAKEKDKIKVIKKEDQLKIKVTVKNRGNQNANNVLLRAKLDNKIMIYKENTSCIELIKSGIYEKKCPLDNSLSYVKFRRSANEDILEYFVGNDATGSHGGTLEKLSKNPTNINFISTIESEDEKKEYKKINYEAEYESIIDSKTIRYQGVINECTPQNYILSVENKKEENDFYPRSKEDDPNGTFKNRLFTKIANKPFDIYITNYSKADAKPKIPDSPTDVDIKLVKNCSDENSVLGYPVTLHFTNKDTEKVNVIVKRPYEKLHIKLKYHSKPNNQDVVKCEAFDAFAVRPAIFQLYDKSGSGGVYNGSSVLVGGKDYKDITLAAYNYNKDKDKTTLANGYTNTLIAGSSVTGVNRYTENNVSILPVDKAGCIITEDTKKRLSEDNKLKIAFDNPAKAVGTITNIKTNKEGFSFSDIGNAKFYVVDKSYTSIDKKTPPLDSDCVLDSSENNEDGEGKIGCDIEFGKREFGFEPNDLEVSEFKILPRGISYIANENNASFTPILSFRVKARLFDDNPALLYKDGCYSNNTRFKIKVGEMINGYTDNNDTLLKNDTDGLTKLNSEILFFGNLDASKVEKVHPASLHEGLFEVKKEAFKGGYADVNLKFNFKREKNVAKNPFEVTSDTFTFESLVDANKTKNNGNYKKPTTKTSAKFYYARTYAPYYEGPNTGFKAKIYYGVYCNGCDESKFMLQKPGSSARWEEFAGTHSWYVNPLHDASYGNVDSYDFSNHTTRDTAKETALSDGISYIYVKNDRAVTDIAKMNTENWLIYNEFDKDAATNDFTVRFLVPNGDWAGKTLKSGSSKGDVGNVVGGENNFNDLSDKTNRRISW